MSHRLLLRTRTAVSIRTLSAIALAWALAGCSTPWFKPYRVEIQQGNFVSSEMVALLKPGMTRDQVRFTLGSPMVTPLFRANQWDYVFYQRRTTGDVVERRLTLTFENDRLARWQGDDMPSELPKTATDTNANGKTS